MARDDLYTARWCIARGIAVADGAPRRALLALLERELGPIPPLVSHPADPAAPPLPELPEPPTTYAPKWRHPAGGKFPIVGHPLGNGRLPAYLAGIDPAATWKPSAICIHHTAAPNLATRPRGLEPPHMDNLRDYYLSQGWKSGPHWFVDDHAAWPFSPMTSPGVHAKAFNRSAIGIEMLGDYDSEDPKTGRGALVLARTCDLVRRLMALYGITVEDIVFHRDDPQTDKSCPGRLISKSWFLSRLAASPQLPAAPPAS